jgi:diaminohydroxyphosphoribosylaminopyrimidine deaminase/5-amino-6-(5-phosphoribosylamino)uracil reductase
MRMAIDLAAQGLGATWPNPSVGCVLVKDGRIIARAVTGKSGRPHAETEALRLAGPAAAGCTAYVSLEPCAHVGRTPPCADALVQARVARVVVACADPDPRVSGRGIRRLRAAGIEVTEDVLRSAAERDHAGFFSRVRRGRPMVSLKLATSLDGRIATATGESQWITGPQARAYGHHLRATHDAIMVGSGTGLADDPALTCRLPGMLAASPVRAVLDPALRLPPTSQLVAGATEIPVWAFCADDAPTERERLLSDRGVAVIRTPGGEGGLDLPRVLRALADRGITRLMVEGGPRVAASFLRADLVDDAVLLHGPVTIGPDGVDALDGLALDALTQSDTLRLRDTEVIGEDRLERYERR